MSIRPYTQIIVHDYTKDERRADHRLRREAKVRDRILSDRVGSGSPVLLVSDPIGAGGFFARPASLSLRLLARLFAGRLDVRLASGRAPESSRLLAARARQLASLPVRRSLARNWRDLSAEANRPPTVRTPRAPLCRDRIVAAQSSIRALCKALSTTLPVPARGVAMASQLLCDGTGPLYNPSCATDLAAALDQVIESLDPAVALAA